MQQTYDFKNVLKRVQECLKELGFDADVKVSEHEGIVFARKEIEGKCVQVVTHMTDREVKPLNAGAPPFEIAKSRASQVAIRPTLASQTATRYVKENGQKPCD
jgi:hypothetical protein